MVTKVAVNGYGTIGKRIADALRKVGDFEVVGVSKYTPDYEAIVAARKGFKVFVPRGKEEAFREIGIEPEGDIDYLLEEAELIYDASPGGHGSRNKELYLKLKKPAVFQGGEDSSIAEVSFSTLCNYSEAVGKRYVRVVSCNTTGLLRTICSLRDLGVKRVFGVIIRRGSDPKEDKRGPINSIKLDPPAIPSHHAVDARTVVVWLNIDTVAVVVPTTLMHTHVLEIELGDMSLGKIVAALTESGRIVMAPSSLLGLDSTSQLVELSRDLGRERYDIFETVVFGDTVSVKDGRLYLVQAVHQESIVIPENVDAGYAMMNLETDPVKVVEKVNRALGVGALGETWGLYRSGSSKRE